MNQSLEMCVPLETDQFDKYFENTYLINLNLYYGRTNKNWAETIKSMLHLIDSEKKTINDTNSSIQEKKDYREKFERKTYAQ